VATSIHNVRINLKKPKAGKGAALLSEVDALEQACSRAMGAV
jgi:hypothetical protein